MSFYKFEKDDVLNNRIKTHPKCEFVIYDSTVYHNNKPPTQGANTANVGHVASGFVNLYEINVDRPSGELVDPFITKDGTRGSFKTITTTTYNTDFAYGDTITGSYPLSASITKQRFAANTGRDTGNEQIPALKNTLNYYTPLSRHYAYSSSLDDSSGGWNKGAQELSLFNIPSIFYGSSIEKGTVSLKFYVSGTLIGKLRDENKNGELIQVGPPNSNGSGSVAGVVLYNEGFMILTGSWDISGGAFAGEKYLGGTDNSSPTWLHFGAGANDGIAQGKATKSSFEMTFSGTNYVPTLTMLAHAPRGELNHSNNLTYIKYNETELSTTGSYAYIENVHRNIANVVSSSYVEPTGSFKKTTFISKVGIYDKHKNLIGIANLATPVKKTEDREFTFKLKLDF